MSKTYTQLSTQSDSDQINRFLLGQEANLTPALTKKLDRLQVAADLLRKFGSRMKVAGMLQKLWPTDCSRATSYRYIEEAQDVFAPQQMASREFYVDVVMGMLFSTREKALAKQDLKTVAATEKNIMVGIAKFFGTSESLPIEKFQVPHYEVGFYPGLVNSKLPDNYKELIAQILKVRKTGVVADQDVTPADTETSATHEQ